MGVSENLGQSTPTTIFRAHDEDFRCLEDQAPSATGGRNCRCLSHLLDIVDTSWVNQGYQWDIDMEVS